MPLERYCVIGVIGLKRIGLKGTCIGCGAKVKDPECDCDWATCSSCGYSDCWVREDGTYHCYHCDFESDHRRRMRESF